MTDALRCSRGDPDSYARETGILNVGNTLAGLPEPPAMVFFPHWSERLPADVYERYECVMFHMTDLPFGRGGSPLQHLILAGHTLTTMTAFRATAELDAGPVYLRAPLELDGSAQAILDRAHGTIVAMIDLIRRHRPVPQPQAAPTLTRFRRRRPEESQLPTALGRVYDHIRMLDAEGYPHAFLHYGDLRLEFTEAAQAAEEAVTARVRITGR